MALARRSGARFEANIWPGFVDAMTALLLVLMFVLTVFLFLQYVLQETITGQQTEIDELSFELSTLAEALGLEQQRADGLERDLGIATTDLGSANDFIAAQTALIAGLRADNADAMAQIASFETQVASLLARNDDLGRALAASRSESAERAESLRATEAEVARLETDLSEEISASEALRLALASARDEIDQQAEEARLAAAQREALETLIADLQSDLAGREATITELAADLTASEVREQSLTQRLSLLAADLATREGELEAALASAVELSEELDAAEVARLERLAAIEALQARLAETEATLSDTEAARLAEEGAAEALRQLLAEADPEADEDLTGRAAAEALRRRLADADAELTAMTLALEEQRAEAEETLTLLAAAEAARRTIETARADDLSEIERQRALLALANQNLTQQRAQTTEARRRIALLNQQSAALNRQLSELQGLLEQAEERDAENQIQLEALGNRLNTALAQVAAEERRRAEELLAEAQDLRNYRSEFFGRMRELLGERQGVQVVGDRFVFASEVLFASGSANLSGSGRDELARVADVLLEVAESIPSEIAWILRVDGHTDIIPVGEASRFASNWELSQARALSVVEFLIAERGMPPDRLAATGFGEFQPIDTATTPEAFARNRRIELKLTER
ncbi:MAG: peptidoglycan -binding protein [Pseudomonadota bacterium]